MQVSSVQWKALRREARYQCGQFSERFKAGCILSSHHVRVLDSYTYLYRIIGSSSRHLSVCDGGSRRGMQSTEQDSRDSS